MKLSYLLFFLISSVAYAADPYPENLKDILFYASGSCDDPSKIVFNKVGTHFTGVIGTHTDGREIFVFVTMSIVKGSADLSEGTFVMYYMEYVVGENNVAEPLFENKYEGKWYPDDMQLQLTMDLGDGKQTEVFVLKRSGLKVDGISLIEGVFWPEFPRQFEESPLMALKRVGSATGSQGESREEYCNAQNAPL